MLPVVGGHGMMYGYGIGAGFLCFMMLMWLIIVIAVVYFIYKKLNRGKNEALDLLKMKFVKGEITEEEYINKKNILLKK